MSSALANLAEAMIEASESQGKVLAKNLAEDAASKFLKNSDDIGKALIKEVPIESLARGSIEAFGDVAGDSLRLANKSEDLLVSASKGVDGIAEISVKINTSGGQKLVKGVEEVATQGKLTQAGVEEGQKLGEEATKAEGGLGNWLKNNPRCLVVGLSVAGVSLFILINYLANGTSPGDSLRELGQATGDVLSEVAAVVGGLANSFAGGLLGPLWDSLKKFVGPALIVVGVIILIVIILKIRGKK
jgi:hypothetical protein